MYREYYDECAELEVNREVGVYKLKDGRIVTVTNFRKNTKGKYPLCKEHRA
jgi:hypothetical protein